MSGSLELALDRRPSAAVLTLAEPTPGPYAYVTPTAGFAATGVHDIRLRLRGRWREGPAKTRWRTTAAPATFLTAVRENQEVVPVNTLTTWVLPSGVTAGR
ncbi:hypothetical protein [Streptomyces sp. NPDC059224]|uniref:hypothetical protein n=1 Tax=Streptomyces sp. NPDC059224 TaxID=3346775 RepID=UPI0036C0A72E